LLPRRSNTSFLTQFSIEVAMKRMLPILCVMGMVAAAVAACRAVQAADAAEKKDRVFELRTYVTHPGKLPDLNKRFRDHTCRIFQKHGIELIGFWTPAEGPQAENTLIYVVAFPSMEAREKAWKAFGSDPEWKKVYAESHKDGVIVKKVESTLMNPVDYSPIR
jgi:hypothetical protein